MKKLRAAIASIVCHEDVNFLLTNRIPRRLATNFIGWFSQIENPLVRDLSIGIWRLFADLDLSEARERASAACMIASSAGCAMARGRSIPIRMCWSVRAMPSSARAGASRTAWLLQIKGFPYQLRDLLTDAAHAETYRNGSYVTLRLTSSMYHRFHAPYDCRVESVSYISGDTWNVNPIALKRVERLFCKNERAAIRIRLDRTGHAITLVPVAAILVASIRLNFLGSSSDVRQSGPRTTLFDVPLTKGKEMGWFQHGSTIIVFAPNGFTLAENVQEGDTIRMGEPLMRLPGAK